MKTTGTILLFLVVNTVMAQNPTWVNGYVTSSGQYVDGHYRTMPNQTRNDNFSTRPTVNPFTGTVGLKPRDEDVLTWELRQQSVQLPLVSYPTYSTPSLPSYQTYSAPQTYPTPVLYQPVYVGPRGGIYHYSASGRKVYH